MGMVVIAHLTKSSSPDVEPLCFNLLFPRLENSGTFPFFQQSIMFTFLKLEQQAESQLNVPTSISLDYIFFDYGAYSFYCNSLTAIKKHDPAIHR